MSVTRASNITWVSKNGDMLIAGYFQHAMINRMLYVISESKLTVYCKSEVLDTTMGSTHGEYPNAAPNSTEDY